MLSGTTGGLGSFGELTLGYHGIGRDTVTSQLPDQKWTLTIDRPMRVGFSLTSSQTDVDLRLFHGKTPRVTSTTPGLAPESFARTLRPGHYTLIVSKHAQADGYYELHVDTSVVASPTRVEAEALGGTAVRVNWLDHSDNESGFAVQQWRKHKWHTVVRADKDATAAVVHNQPINAAMTFRVRSEASGGTGISPGAVMVQTGVEDTSGWFKVSNLSAMIQGEARWVPDGGTLSVKTDDQDKWIQAASWQDAVYSAIEGTANFKKTNGDPVSHTFSGEGDFKVGYAGIMHDDFPDDDGKTGDPPGTFPPIQIDGNNLPTNDQLKVITLEDSYGEVDEDYDDFYWTMDVQERADLAIDGVTDESQPEPNEISPGAFISLNNDDDDLNDVRDLEQTQSVPGENNMVAMHLSLPPSMRANPSGTATLTITGSPEQVLVWGSQDKSGGDPPLLGGSLSATKTWNADEMPETVYLEGIAASSAIAAITFKLQANPSSGPATQPATTKAAVVAGPIQPDSDQQGITGDIVPSVKQQGIVLKHYVSPKAADGKVVLKVDPPAGANFDDVYVWDGGDAVAGSPNKRSVSRATPGRFEVKLKDKKTGNVVDTMVVWIVWAPFDAAPDDHAVGQIAQTFPVQGGVSLTKLEVSELTLFTIQPATIVTDPDRPDFSGTPAAVPNAPLTPGLYNAGRDLQNGANSNWDTSRQLRQKVLNPNNLNLANYKFPNGDDAYADYQTWPADPLLGNDDNSTNDEDDDPYAAGQIAKGLIGVFDYPNIKLDEQDGAVGDTIEVRMEFRDFARLEIGGKWFPISDLALWRFHAKLQKVDEAVVGNKNGDQDATDVLWIDNNSTAAEDNAGW